MEMGLSQADVARRLNVSRSVVQRLWDQYQSEDSVSRRLCSRPTTSYNTCRRPFSSSFGTKEKNHYCAAARCRPLSHQEEESPLLRCEIVFTMQVCMQEDQLCAFPSTDDSEGTAYAGQENMFLERGSNGLLNFAVLERVQIYNGSDSGRLLIWRGTAH
ncbi:uncharacterized protein TNCV_3987731 [Trichonephila clavipes]|nr:uncharacterized protein TNCV_3987731 [Trichonephila clavipes]